MFQLIRNLTEYTFSHYQACKLSLKNLISTPLSSCLTVLAITLSFTLPILSLITLSNIQTLTQNLDTSSKITLYLQNTTPLDQADTLLATLLKKKEIESGTYTPPEVVLDQFKNWSHMDEAIALLPDNPLPGVITLYPKADYRTPVALKRLTDRLANFTEVDRITFDQEGIGKLHAILQFTETLFFILMGLMGLSMILVIANTIRLALERHKEELDLLTLIGATPAFIRRPFLYRGFWYGLVGALLGYGLVTLLLQPLEPLLQKIALLYNQSFELNIGDATLVGIVAITGIILGWLGALAALLLYKKAPNAS